MNTRRPTAAAGARWRKFGAEPPALDPDPLNPTDVDHGAYWEAGWEEGYERGITESIPPVVALLVIGIATFVFGLAIGLTWSAWS